MKKILIGAFVLALLLIAFIAFGLPYLISTEAARSALLTRIHEITGRQIDFSGDPVLFFDPFFGVELKDVSFENISDNSDSLPILSAPGLKGKISIGAALTGKIDFDHIQFIRPHFNFKTYRSGFTNWAFPEGKVWSHMERSKQILAETEAGKMPDLSKLDLVNLGHFEIVDGVIVYDNEEHGWKEEFTNVNGNLTWPNTRSAADFSGSAVWRGDVINLNGATELPIMVLSGGASPFVLELKSEPLNLAFSGEINRFSNLFFNGMLDVTAPSLQRAGGLLGIKLLPGIDLSDFTLGAKASGTLAQMAFDDAQIQLGGNLATGTLSYVHNDDKPGRISGTLAYDRLDVAALFGALENFPEQIDHAGFANIVSLFGALDTDFRLSAKTVNAGQFQIIDFAGAIAGSSKGIKLDIGNGTISGVAVSGTAKLVMDGASADENGEESGDQTGLNSGGGKNRPLSLLGDLKFSGVDLSAMPFITQRSPLVPKGAANLSLTLRSGPHLPATQQILQNLAGQVNLSIKEGVLGGIALTRPTDKTAANQLSTANVFGSGKTMPIKDMTLTAHIQNGTAWLGASEFSSNDTKLRLTGKYAITGDRLALWGAMAGERAKDEDKSDKSTDWRRSLQFFIGGALAEPDFEPKRFAGEKIGP